MEVFTGSTEVTVNKSHFSSIGRDQVNYYTTHQHIVRTRGKIRENLPRLEEFNEVKQGNIIKDKNIGESWLHSSGEMVETAVYTARILAFGNEMFTVKAYNGGRKARKRWRRDFLKCSNDWFRDIPLFGYNKSSVPLLIFYGELIPMAHIEKGLPAGGVGDLYIELLRETLGCLKNELWMDPSKGRFFHGPAGPKCLDRSGDFQGVTIPPDIEFLKEDTVIRYFFSKKDDIGLSWALEHSSRIVPPGYEFAYPQIFSSLTNSTIAFKRNVRWKSWKGCLDLEESMSDGMTRFRLKDDQRRIEIHSVREATSWLSQALSVFHAHGIEVDDELSDYELLYPHFIFTGTLQRSKHRRQRRRLWTPTYLFLLPSPSPTRRFYFWSHDPLGRIPLSRDRCKYIGVPFELSISVEYYRESWPTEIYKTLHSYQITRGFDPKTTGFARFMRYPIYEVVPPENRFQELEEEFTRDTAASEDLPLPMVENTQVDSEDSYDIGVEAPGSTNLSSYSAPIDTAPTEGVVSTQQVSTMRSLLSTLFSSFTLEAVEGSGIPAVGI